MGPIREGPEPIPDLKNIDFFKRIKNLIFLKTHFGPRDRFLGPFGSPGLGTPKKSEFQKKSKIYKTSHKRIAPSAQREQVPSTLVCI